MDFAWLLAHGQTLLEILGALALVGGLIARLTPNQTDDKVVNFILSLLKAFAPKVSLPAQPSLPPARVPEEPILQKRNAKGD